MAEVRTYYPNATSVDTAAPIQLQRAQVLEGMDIALAREPTFCVRSHVLDPGVQRTGRIRVQITSDFYMGTASLAEGEVAPGGGFEVCGLPAGAYNLLASPLDQGSEPRYASEAFSVSDRSLRLPDFSLRPLIQLSGRLAIDTSSGAKALSGPVLIRLIGIGRPLVLDEKRHVEVSEPGPFVIPAVLPAEYWLDLRAPADFYVKSAMIAGRDALREPLHTARGELQIVLGQDGARLSLAAAGADNAPLAGASVIVGRDPLPVSYAPGDLIAATCDQSGQAM